MEEHFNINRIIKKQYGKLYLKIVSCFLHTALHLVF